MSSESLISLIAVLLGVYNNENIKVIRVGLQSVSELCAESKVAAGFVHPATRQLAEGKAILDSLIEELDILDTDNVSLNIMCDKKWFTASAGHNKENIKSLYKKYNFRKITFSDKNKFLEVESPKKIFVSAINDYIYLKVEK